MVAEREVFDSGFDLDRKPTLEALFRIFGRNLELNLRTACPGTIVKFDVNNGKAWVRVDHKTILKDFDLPFGEREDVDHILTNIPVHFPRANGGLTYDTMPIIPGDTGMLISADRSLEQWMTSATGLAVDPVSMTLHSLADSEFYPGLHPDSAPIAPAIDLTARVIESAQIKLGRTATEALLRATSFEGVIDAVFAAATPAAMDGGASLKATALAAWNALKAAGLYKTIKTKAE